MTPPTSLIRARIEPKLRLEDECLVFTGTRTYNGYGNIKILGNNYRAHRLIWIASRGPIPDGMCVLHTCDNPPCCNIEHLWIGTRADNVSDMIAKGRQGSPPGARLAYGNIANSDYQRSKTACPQGHPYSGENLRIRPNGSRCCRACRRASEARRRAAR